MAEKGIRTSAIVTAIIIISILSLSGYILLKDNPPANITEKDAKCIGENSELYVQAGCSACATQEEMFGENAKYLNQIDCFLVENRQDCLDKNIEATPTWIIKGKMYRGVQSIDALKSLTGC